MEAEIQTLDEKIDNLNNSFLDKIQETLSDNKMSNSTKAFKIEYLAMNYKTDKIGLTISR